MSANLQLDNTRLQVEARIQGQFNEMQQLQEAMQAYDVPLMHHTLRLLYDAVTAGQLSIIDFYVEPITCTATCKVILPLKTSIRN